MAMTEGRSVDVTCSNCSMDLTLRYVVVQEEPKVKHPLGCPECQSPTDVLAAVERLEAGVAPRFIYVSALTKRIEIGLGSEMPAHVGGREGPRAISLAETATLQIERPKAAKQAPAKD